jgi:hypothetical protein
MASKDDVINIKRPRRRKSAPKPTRKSLARPKSERRRIERLLAGEISIADLDDIEIAHGQPYSLDGTFIGPEKRMIPASLASQLQAEMFKRVRSAFLRGLPTAMRVHTELMVGEDVPESVRMRAVEAWQDRALGRTAQSVVVHNDVDWADTFDGVSLGYGEESNGEPDSAEVPIDP